MNSAEIAAKSVEISKCLINKETGFHDVDLFLTNNVGNAARLAVNLRKRGYVSYEELGGISQVLKQNFSSTVDTYLKIIEELGWVEINKSNKERYIEESIPPIEDVLSVLGGEVWMEKEPTPVDISTIESLALLKNKPMPKEELSCQISVLDKFDRSLEYGNQMDYFGNFVSSDNQEIIWTPFYWPENTEKILKYLKRQHYEEFDELEDVSRKLSKSQGLPLDILNDSELLTEGISCGFFPSVGVIGGNNINYEYVFRASPNLGIDPKNDIFEKARQIVACVRHGQYHAEHSKIRYPLLILIALQENRLGPHSYAKIQYAQLIVNGVCKYEEFHDGYKKLYKIRYISTPENDIAMNMAKEMLQGIENPMSSMNEPEIDSLISQGVYNFTSEQRQIKNRNKVLASSHFNRLIEVTQGRSW